MGRMDYLAMKTDEVSGEELINADLRDLKDAAKNLFQHAVKLGGVGFGTSFLKWVASFAAMYVTSSFTFSPVHIQFLCGKFQFLIFLNAV